MDLFIPSLAESSCIVVKEEKIFTYLFMLKNPTMFTLRHFKKYV